MRVEVRLIAGKSTPIAKAVDRDAKTASKLPSRADGGFRPGKVGRSKNNTGRAARLFPAAGQEIVVRIYQTLPVRRDVQKVKFQTYCEQRKEFFDNSRPTLSLR